MHWVWSRRSVFAVKSKSCDGLITLSNSFKQVKYKNICTQSINISEIMENLAMFSIQQLINSYVLWVLIKWKWVIIFQSWIPSGIFLFPTPPTTPHPNFELIPTETWGRVQSFPVFLLELKSSCVLMFANAFISV